MKKLLLILFLVSFIYTYSQESDHKIFSVGFVFGIEQPLSSGIDYYDDGYNYYDSYDYGVRINGGVVFNIAFTEKFGLQPEILLQYRNDDLNEGGYLIIPIMVEFKPFGNGISFQFGPRIGGSIWGDYYDYYYDEYYYDEYYDDFSFFGDFDIGFQGGAQYRAPFGLFTNIRLGYSYGTYYEEGVLTAGVSLGMLF